MTAKKRKQSPEAKEKIRQKMLARHREARITAAQAEGREPDPADLAAQEAYEVAEAAPEVASAPLAVSPSPPSVDTAAIEAMADTDPVRAMKEAIPEAFVPIRTAIGEAALEEERAVRPNPPAGAETKTVHFLADGFTTNGKVWYRGETFSVAVDSDAFRSTCDRNGVSWMDLSEVAQVNRYGERMFAPGPWPYQQADDASDDAEYQAALASDDPEVMRNLEKRRNRERLERASVASAPSRG